MLLLHSLTLTHPSSRTTLWLCLDKSSSHKKEPYQTVNEEKRDSYYIYLKINKTGHNFSRSKLCKIGKDTTFNTQNQKPFKKSPYNRNYLNIFYQSFTSSSNIAMSFRNALNRNSNSFLGSSLLYL